MHSISWLHGPRMPRDGSMNWSRSPPNSTPAPTEQPVGCWQSRCQGVGTRSVVVVVDLSSQKSLQNRVEFGCLSGCEHRTEVDIDVSGVNHSHASSKLLAFGGESGEHHTAIGFAMTPLDESIGRKASDDSVARAVRHEQSFGELAHAHRTIVGAQLMQHVIFIERSTERGSEVLVHGHRGRSVVVEQLAPCVNHVRIGHNYRLDVFPFGNKSTLDIVVLVMTTPTIDIRRSSDRFHTRAGWLDSKHSFSFGGHYSPANTNHGQLLVLNDDRVVGGAGFDTHPHRDMEIITWVLDGELEHKDSEGNRGLIYPGLAQRMSAGRGIWHSEKNWSNTDEVHFIQMWVLPDTQSIDPSYQQLDINDQLAAGGMVPIASGQGHDAAISIHQSDAVLWGGRLGADEHVTVPGAEFGHVFVARGCADLESQGTLATGDAARLSGADGIAMTAGDEGAELLIWTTGAMP